MKIKFIFLCLSLFILNNCTSSLKKEILDVYINREGYINSHPKLYFINQNSERTSPFPFLICEKSKITNIKSSLGSLFVYIKQGNNEAAFSIKSELDLKENRIHWLEQHFVDDLKISNMKLTGELSKYSAKDLICKNKVFIGMTTDQLTIIYGEPQKINRTITKNTELQQWVYQTNEDFKFEYFYFENGNLRSWQN